MNHPFFGGPVGCDQHVLSGFGLVAALLRSTAHATTYGYTSFNMPGAYGTRVPETLHAVTDGHRSCPARTQSPRTPRATARAA